MFTSRHELKSGTNPHTIVKPRSEAYSQVIDVVVFFLSIMRAKLFAASLFCFTDTVHISHRRSAQAHFIAFMIISVDFGSISG